jgi:hypothetical protein
MTETTRQPDGQWCWCDDPPENQPPHDCAEDHATRPACQCDGAHVHPWSRQERQDREQHVTHLPGRDIPEPPAWVDPLDAAAVFAYPVKRQDREHAVNDASRLTEHDRNLIADALRVGPLVRARGSDEDRLAGWLLTEMAGAMERLGGTAELAPPAPIAEAVVYAWCKRCRRGTRSVPCPRCDGPACAGCGRCPPCDGPVPDKDPAAACPDHRPVLDSGVGWYCATCGSDAPPI